MSVNASHSGNHLATKADIARLEGGMDALSAQVKLLVVLVVGLYVGIALLVWDRL